MHPLTTLACGNATTSGTIAEVHLHLANSLDRMLVRGRMLKKDGNTVDLALFGPSLGRATIEVALTAILARFDPFRVLAIRKTQLSTDYDAKIRNPLAFNWLSDVKGEESPKDWTNRPGIKDVQRALLCKHFNDLFWEEAFTKMIDNVPYDRGKTWMTSLKKINPEGFLSSMRTNADRIYSELSKGVHHEFVIPITAQYDAATVDELLSSSWELVGALSVTSCYSPAVKPLEAADPLDLYEQAQEELYS
ncbi:MAG: hypothetical protein WBL70_00640 [Candidatus Acidiferrales bacterium]